MTIKYSFLIILSRNHLMVCSAYAIMTIHQILQLSGNNLKVFLITLILFRRPLQIMLHCVKYSKTAGNIYHDVMRKLHHDILYQHLLQLTKELLCKKDNMHT